MLTFERQINYVAYRIYAMLERHAKVDTGVFLLVVTFVDCCGISFDCFLVHPKVGAYVEAIAKLNRLAQWTVQVGHARLGDGDGKCPTPCEKDPKKNRGLHCLRC